MKINHMRKTQVIYAELSIGKGVSTITCVWKRPKGRQRSEKSFVGGKGQGTVQRCPIGWRWSGRRDKAEGEHSVWLVRGCTFGFLGVFVCTCVQLFATPWTVARQAPLSVGFSSQEYWSGLLFPPPGDLPDPGIEPVSLVSPALAGRFFTTEPPGKPTAFSGLS